MNVSPPSDPPPQLRHDVPPRRPLLRGRGRPVGALPVGLPRAPDRRRRGARARRHRLRPRRRRHGSQLGRFFNTTVSPQLIASETAHAQVIARGFQPEDVGTSSPRTSISITPAAWPTSPRRSTSSAPSWRPRSRPTGARAPVTSRRIGCMGRAGSSTGGRGRMAGLPLVRHLPALEEILLIPLPGHTLGHTGVAIRRGEGWLLHCGDAFFHHGEVQTPPHCPPGLRFFQNVDQTDGKARRENRERAPRAGRAARRRGRADLLARRPPARHPHRRAGSPRPPERRLLTSRPGPRPRFLRRDADVSWWPSEELFVSSLAGWR